MATDTGRLIQARDEVTRNEPPVEPGQYWITRSDFSGKVVRRIKILAEYTGDFYNGNGEKCWLYEESKGGIMRVEIGRIGTVAEFNLRYVFRPEDIQ